MIYGYFFTEPNGGAVKAELEAYAKQRGLSFERLVEDADTNKTHWERREISTLLASMSKGDEFIIYEAADMARSTSQVLEILEQIAAREVILHLVKYNEIFTGERTVDTRSFIKFIQQIESDFVARRTTEALARRRMAGLPLGRPKGRCNKSLKLDKHRKDIQKYMNLGVSKASIAKLINCHAQTLYNYIEKRQLKPEPMAAMKEEEAAEAVTD